MGRLIVIVAVLLILWLGGKWLLEGYREKGRAFAVKSLLVAVAIIFILLAATGRAHWLGAALASLLAGLRFALPLLIRSLPFLQKILAAKAAADQHSNTHSPPTSTSLTLDEALEVLGLEPNPSRDEIVDAHRKLIQKLHPDRGGNDYLAAKINQAKDLLLKHYHP